MRNWTILVVLVFLATGRAVGAAAPATAPATEPDFGLSQAQAQRLITLLSADDFAVRQEALEKLQQTVGANMKRTILLQETIIQLQQALVDQLVVLTHVRDLEGVARSAAVLEFNEALSRWAIEAMQLPADQRAAVLQWGLSAEGMQIVSRAYSPNSDVRVAGVAELSRVPGTAVSVLLARMISDTDRAVALAAMDALWDRPPTPQGLAVLWDRGIGAIMVNYGMPRTERNRVLNFHGRMITVNNANNINWEDSAVATDVLAHLQAPETAARLRTFLLDLANAPTDNNNNNYRYQMLLPNYGGPGQNLTRLIDAFKPREVISVYMRFITNPAINDGNNGEATINGKTYHYSMRIEMAYRLCKAIGQDPDTYGFRKVPQYGDRAMLEGSQKEEDAALGKIKAWWETHKFEYGEKPTAAATAPAAKPK